MIEVEEEEKDEEDIKLITQELEEVDVQVNDNLNKIKTQKKKFKKEKKKQEEDIEELEDKEKCLADSLIESARRANMQIKGSSSLHDVNIGSAIKQQMQDRMDKIIQHENDEIQLEKKLEGNIKDTMIKT